MSDRVRDRVSERGNGSKWQRQKKKERERERGGQKSGRALYQRLRAH